MNLQIIDGCAGTDPRLPTAGTNPDYRLREPTLVDATLLEYKT